MSKTIMIDSEHAPGMDKYDALVGVGGRLTLVIDEKVLDVDVENIGGFFHIILPELGGIQVKIRDVLESAGYRVTWEALSKTIIAAKI